MLKRQSPTTTCIPLSSKRPRVAHGVSARGRLDVAANAIPSKPKRKRVTQKKKQPRTRVYDEINDRTVLTTVPASDEDLSASDCDGNFLSPKWKPINRTPIDEPNPGVRNEIRKQEVSLLKNELLSDLVVSENEIQDQIRKSIKVLYHPLISSSVTSIPPESWTLSQLARIPDGSPTRDFVPPWFASHSPSPCVVCAQSRDASSPSHNPPSHTHYKTPDLLHDFADEIRSEFKLLEDDNEGELWTAKFIDRGLDRKKDDGIVDAEPDLMSRSGGLDDGSRDLAKTHSPTKMRASEWWDTAYFNELVAKVYKLLLVAGDEIVT
ncbi:hypothetical protein V1522DRAFT_402774 [Lipomyces starkeyi]